MKRILLILLALSSLVFLLRCAGDHHGVQDDTKEVPSDSGAPDADMTAYYQEGDQAVKTAFQNLSSQLKSKMQSEGPAGAVAYCNVEAERLTSEKVSDVVSIGRVSTKNRSPQNAANEKEAALLKHYAQIYEQEGTPHDTVIVEGETAHFYRPITLQPLCLNCHGTPNEQILPETLAVIDSLYPADKARNYRIGDLRGMWHVALAVNE